MRRGTVLVADHEDVVMECSVVLAPGPATLVSHISSTDRIALTIDHLAVISMPNARTPASVVPYKGDYVLVLPDVDCGTAGQQRRLRMADSNLTLPDPQW